MLQNLSKCTNHKKRKLLDFIENCSVLSETEPPLLSQFLRVEVTERGARGDPLSAPPINLKKETYPLTAPPYLSASTLFQCDREASGWEPRTEEQHRAPAHREHRAEEQHRLVGSIAWRSSTGHQLIGIDAATSSPHAPP
jgi:hypothetical protein